MIPLRKEKIRLLESLTINDYKVPGLILMENAGSKAAEIIHKELTDPTQDQVTILCGKGNNGGDGFVIARHLNNLGVSVKVFLFADRKLLIGDAKVNLEILYKMKVFVEEVLNIEKVSEAIKASNVIVDAMLGTGVDGEIKESLKQVVRVLNSQSNKKVYAIDTPTGLDCNTGIVLGECVKATKTLTFIAAKTGFYLEKGPENCGEIVIIDISIPTDLIVSVQQKELEYLEQIGLNLWDKK